MSNLTHLTVTVLAPPPNLPFLPDLLGSSTQATPLPPYRHSHRPVGLDVTRSTSNTGVSVSSKICAINRADMMSQVWQCLGFCSAEFSFWVLVSLLISWPKTQTLPNLRLLISSGNKTTKSQSLYRVVHMLKGNMLLTLKNHLHFSTTCIVISKQSTVTQN